MLLMRIAGALLISGCLAPQPADSAGPAQPGGAGQSYEDAWWTGPLLASGASTLPHGHFLIEPYVFDVRSYGAFDRDGTLHKAVGRHNVHSLTYALYGLTDRFTVGLIPQFGFNASLSDTRRSRAGLADLGIHAQYRLCAFHEGSWIPTLSLVAEQTLPTGRYDGLGHYPDDGLGGGHYTTSLAVYMQRYFWAPNGRIVRTRLDISYARSSRAHLHDVSVYGTAEGFRGAADPGDALVADFALEYSATRHWVWALDANYERDGSTALSGYYPGPAGSPLAMVAFDRASGMSKAVALAPALEYNFSARFGLIAGARITVWGRNATALAIPVVAFNMVL